MKFARRSESIKESRAIFKRAREDSRTNFHVGNNQRSECDKLFKDNKSYQSICFQVFISAALMEYYCSKVSPRIHFNDVIIVAF